MKRGHDAAGGLSLCFNPSVSHSVLGHELHDVNTKLNYMLHVYLQTGMHSLLHE